VLLEHIVKGDQRMVSPGTATIGWKPMPRLITGDRGKDEGM
jgi:hypothetical protein